MTDLATEGALAAVDMLVALNGLIQRKAARG